MIDRFIGEYSFLSNFYPVYIKYEGRIYPSVENAYQAQKTDNEYIKDIFLDLRPAEAKRVGKKLKLTSDWEEKKFGLMAELVGLKFRNPMLKRLLLDTGDNELVERNYWGDVYWGVCRGIGENKLGRILMDVRAASIGEYE